MFTRTTVVNRGPASLSGRLPRLRHLALVSLIFLTGCGFGGAEAGNSHFAVGEKLPALELLALTGKATNLELADLKDRVTLIHFWGTWCPPCVVEIPHIAAIEKELRDRPDFALLAISSQPGLDPELKLLREETDAFLKAQKLDLPTYADVNDISRSTFHKIAGWRGYPATMIIDKQSVIRGVWFGYQETDIAEMKQVLAGLLELEKEEAVLEEPVAKEATAPTE